MRLSTLAFASLSCLVSAVLAASIAGRSQSSLSTDNKIPGNSPLVLCPGEHGDDIVWIDQVDLDPNPPLAGHDLEFRAHGYVKKPIKQGAYANVTIKYGVIKLLTTQLNLCDQMQNVNVTCPIEKGPLEIAKTVHLPGEIPPGRYTVHVAVHNNDDESITCLDATVSFGRKTISFAGLEL